MATLSQCNGYNSTFSSNSYKPSKYGRCNGFAMVLQWFCNGSAMVRLRHSNGKEEVLNFNFPYEVELGAKIV